MTGIFDSSLPEFDELFALVDFRQVQKLNNWNENQIAGYEVLVSDFDNLKNIGSDVKMVTASYIDPDGLMLRTRTIQEAQPQIFGWLDLGHQYCGDSDSHCVMAGFNMISGLLILILERTNMIFVFLKAVGADNQLLRRVFVYLAVFIIGRGLILGNLIGLGLCYLQKYTGIIKLDPTNYYLDSVPILINPIHVLLLNLAALVITTVMLVLVPHLVGRISPAKAIRFD